MDEAMTINKKTNDSKKLPSQSGTTNECLRYAQSLGFTPEQYREAEAITQNPHDHNDLLDNLLKIKFGTSNLNSSPTLLTRSSSSSSNQTSIMNSNTHLDITSSPSLSNDIINKNSIEQKIFSNLRPIFVDGCNVAKEHGNNKEFSWLGIRLCCEWFLQRGHKVKVIVPAQKCFPKNLQDEEIIKFLIDKNLLCKTPDDCNDDYYVIYAAEKHNGIIVSNDKFQKEQFYDAKIRSFLNRNQNQLKYTFMDDNFWPPIDPCGAFGPRLDQFLKVQPKVHVTRSQSSPHNIISQKNRISSPSNNHMNIRCTPKSYTTSLPLTISNNEKYSTIDTTQLDISKCLDYVSNARNDSHNFSSPSVNSDHNAKNNNQKKFYDTSSDQLGMNIQTNNNSHNENLCHGLNSLDGRNASIHVRQSTSYRKVSRTFSIYNKASEPSFSE